MRYVLGLYWDNGKEKGTIIIVYWSNIWVYGDNGKENGNYYHSILGFIGLYRDNGKRTWKLL